MRHGFFAFLTLWMACTACNGNISKFHQATASSSFDNNLTAQLVTDGIICDERPAFLEVFTQNGEVGKIERENTLDEDLNTRNIITGKAGWIGYLTHGYKFQADSAKVLFQEALQGGRGGKNFTTVLPVEQCGDSLKIALDFPHEARWRVKDVTFLKDGSKVDNVLPSRHFSSAWMSEGCDDEWIAIDLGAPKQISKIKIHWLNKAGKYSILVSEDNKTWTDFTRHATARFVKITMTDAENGKPFCISEVEIFGKGDSKTADAANDGWKLCRICEVHSDGHSISKPGFCTKGWVDATVPGTVLQSYINLGAVPNPDFGDNISQISESYFTSDWWYRKEFMMTRPAKGRHLHLVFDGINWKALVFFNGQSVGEIAGAFTRADFDITDLVRDGRNALAVKIIYNEHPGSVKTKTKKWTGYNGGILGADNPTFHASIGWDWITTVRGRNCGIWNDVRFFETGCAVVQDPIVLSHILPDGRADITISAAVKADGPVNVAAQLGDIHVSKTIANGGIVTFSPEEFPELSGRKMNLWWPNNYGEPYLYDAVIHVSEKDGTPCDSISFKAGIREVSWTTDKDVLLLYVNGKRICPLGGNWGFSQQNLNFSRKQYFDAVDYHRQMNFNMIRNWVGQVGDEEFYDACDSCGILVWQDFWLANPSDGPNPENEVMFIDNAKDLVSKIRRHPCVTLYCGRNEGFPPESLDSTLRNIVEDLHPGVPYISSSADDVVSGHGPYNALPVEYYFANQSGKFHSERGMPIIPVIESMRKTMPEADIWPFGELWGKHDFTIDGAQKASTYMEMMDSMFGSFDNAEDFCKYAQWLNYDGIRAIFEADGACKRNGLLLWMSHPAWPSMAFITYDYFFQPGGAFFGGKKACEPLHIQYDPLRGMVEVINRCAGNINSLTASMKVYSMNGKIIREKKISLNSRNDTSVDCFLVGPVNGEDVFYIALNLIDSRGAIVSDNFYILGAEAGNIQAVRTLEQPELLIEEEESGIDYKRIVVKNIGTTPALRLRIVLQDSNGNEVLPVNYSDNWFCLMPSEQKTITVRHPLSNHCSITVR